MAHSSLPHHEPIPRIPNASNRFADDDGETRSSFELLYALYEYIRFVDDPPSKEMVYQILPETEDCSQPVHYRLPTSSIDDLTPEYRDFALQSA
jgi:hypothetical protein